ncbi:MAG: hypothetical protein ACREK5_05525 [Gemmatimonadota bacterium]
MKRLILLPLFLFLAAPAVAQEASPVTPASPTADPTDVESIDAIIAALYEVISGPAGDRDWDRFRSLFTPKAILVPMVPTPDGTTPVRALSADDYVARVGPYFGENAFYEVESGRSLDRYGNIANAMSAYESRRAPDEEPFARGINTITLVTDGVRWYVASIAWDQEREGNPFPPEWLPLESEG